VLTPSDLVFFIDVDNTLLDNDAFAADLSARLARDFGAMHCERYWRLFARLREELGVADYLASLQAFRLGLEEHPALLQMSAFLLDYPFASRLYPHSLATLAHLRRLGRTVILSDGDLVFQPRKIQHSGLWDAVDGEVVIEIHKERVLERILRRYPAVHYVMIDDKSTILAAMQTSLGERLTGIWVRQGHYALAPESQTVQPAANRRIESIGELCAWHRHDFRRTVV
jgi:FMN phosphatase YigB (HAD superfamily)